MIRVLIQRLSISTGPHAHACGRGSLRMVLVEVPGAHLAGEERRDALDEAHYLALLLAGGRVRVLDGSVVQLSWGSQCI